MKSKVGSVQGVSSGTTMLIVVPSHIAMDSAWPFKRGEKVNVTIVGQKLIIEKVRPKETVALKPEDLLT
jgi:hypothetical protein